MNGAPRGVRVGPRRQARRWLPTCLRVGRRARRTDGRRRSRHERVRGALRRNAPSGATRPRADRGRTASAASRDRVRALLQPGPASPSLSPRSSRFQGRPAAKAASRLFPCSAVCTTTTGAPHDARTRKVASTGRIQEMARFVRSLVRSFALTISTYVHIVWLCHARRTRKSCSLTGCGWCTSAGLARPACATSSRRPACRRVPSRTTSLRRRRSGSRSSSATAR